MTDTGLDVVTGAFSYTGSAIAGYLLHMSELACTDGPTTGEIRFSDWVGTEGRGLGLRYESEIARHFDRRRDSLR